MDHAPTTTLIRNRSDMKLTMMYCVRGECKNYIFVSITTYGKKVIHTNIRVSMPPSMLVSFLSLCVVLSRRSNKRSVSMCCPLGN